MGDIKVETDALLRDNNFGPDDFSEAVTRSVIDSWSVESEKEEVIAARKDFRDFQTFSINAKSTGDISHSFHVKKVSETTLEVGVHIADIAYFVKPNSLVDREARKRGTGVELVNRLVPMLPRKLAEDLVSLKEGQDRFTVSVVFNVNAGTNEIIEGETWVGKGIIKNSACFHYKEVDAVLSGSDNEGVSEEFKDAIRTLRVSPSPGPCACSES
jgi:protein SSD1